VPVRVSQDTIIDTTTGELLTNCIDFDPTRVYILPHARAGAEASQWDGTDMLMDWGWGLPHSKKTYSAGYGPYWTMSAESAYVESKSKCVLID
jgi:hypothetical protein